MFFSYGTSVINARGYGMLRVVERAGHTFLMGHTDTADHVLAAVLHRDSFAQFLRLAAGDSVVDCTGVLCDLDDDMRAALEAEHKTEDQPEVEQAPAPKHRVVVRFTGREDSPQVLGRLKGMTVVEVSIAADVVALALERD